jgi:hypothetical protein
VAEWKSVREFFTGDFHLLSPLTVSYHDWCACQFHREDLDAGIALFLRRHMSPFSTIEVALKGIDPDGKYDVSLAADYTEPPAERMAGMSLQKMTISISEAPGSVLLRYHRVM